MSNLEDSPDHVVAFFLRLNIGRGRAINSFEVHGLVDVRRQAQGSHPETKLPEPLAVHESSPSSPCGRKRGRERWGGGRGANVEAVVVAVRGQNTAFSNAPAVTPSIVLVTSTAMTPVGLAVVGAAVGIRVGLSVW